MTDDAGRTTGTGDEHPYRAEGVGVVELLAALLERDRQGERVAAPLVADGAGRVERRDGGGAADAGEQGLADVLGTAQLGVGLDERAGPQAQLDEAGGRGGLPLTCRRRYG